MLTRSRLLVALAAVALLPMYLFPLWRISLIAPQYPEGIGMHIHLGTIAGIKEHDLENINQLNHYIGMRVIDPHAIPELAWMPWIVAGIVGGALLVAAAGRRGLLYGWFAVFVAAATAGLVDFWWWTYDYGHHLDYEHAIIKVPGMVYQPPIIGTRQILNFHASSWPSWGGVAAFVAMALAVTAVVWEWRRRPGRATRRSAAVTPITSAAVLLLFLAACGRAEARTLAYDGTESCDVCRMAVTDRRYGAELVTRTGKVLVFDSIECLAGYLSAAGDAARDGRAWVTDFTRPGTFVRADSAWLLRSPGRASPMGRGLLATASEASRDRLQRELGGDALTWRDVVAQAAADRHADAH